MSKLIVLCKQITITMIGLAFFSLGCSFTIAANIGLSPWVALSTGVSNLTNISYGVINAIISLIILGIDLLMKEKVGLGTLLDALFVGVMTEFFLIFIPMLDGTQIIASFIFIAIGLAISSYGQYIYMSGGLCCGPRDALLVALGKKFENVSVGVLITCLQGSVFFISLLLKAPLGLGTFISAFTNGVIMNIVFKIVNFDPCSIQHDSFMDTLNKLFITKKGVDKVYE